VLYVSLLGLWFCFVRTCVYFTQGNNLESLIYIYIYIYDFVSSLGTHITFVVDIQKAFRIQESFHDVPL
jgi:hypothetical protein